MSTPTLCTTTFPLLNGARIPAVGLGTWQGTNRKEDSELRDSIIHALQNGYRLLDTAQLYGVEPIVGEAIRASGIPREEITVITKFWSEWHHDPETALQNSLDAMGLDYVDVFLMHWPCAATPDSARFLGATESPTIVETWKKMEKCVGERCRAIGVSNFTQKTLDMIMAEGTIVPVVNQVELHAFNPNLKLVPWCHSKGIQVMSWSTLGGGATHDPRLNEILTHPLFQKIAENHQCSTGVVSLSWCVQRGVVVIPKSSSLKRLDDNIKLVTLDEAEMQQLNDAHNTIHRIRIANNIKSLQREVDGQLTVMGWTNQDFGWEDAEGNWLS